MEIPKIIKCQAKNLIEQFGDNIEYVGKYQDRDVFQFKLPDNQENGFPIVYLYDSHSNEVEPVGGMETFKIFDNLN